MNVQEVEKIQMELLGKLWNANQSGIYQILQDNYNQNKRETEYDREQIHKLIAINQYIENVLESIDSGDFNEDLWDEENRKNEEE